MASNYDYSYVTEKDGSSADWVEAPGDDMGGNAGELYIEADPIATTQFKGGVHYELGDALSVLNMIPVLGKVYDNTSVWFNFGLIDKAPIFDQVIQDWDAKMATDPTNEKFQAFEIGINTNSNDGTIAGKLNFYSTSWLDRIQTKYIQNLEGDDDIIYLTGIDQVHSGIEMELAWQAHEMARIDLGVGIGNWRFTDNATGTYRDGDADVEFGYSLQDLYVGDMPQNNLSFGLTLTPVDGAVIQTIYRYYTKHYSDWSVSGREYEVGTESGGVPVWQAPAYGILDLHATYSLPFEIGPAKPKVFLHIFNALDEVYIQDAVDQSRYNSWSDAGVASDAEVFFGLPLSFNLGLSADF